MRSAGTTATSGWFARPSEPGSRRRRALRLLGPSLLYIGLFCALPLAWLLWLSLGTGLDNYRDFFGNPSYLRILGGTFLLATETTLLCLLLGYPVAWFLHRLPERWRAAGLLVVVVPYLTSFLARTYAWIVLLADNGVINGTLLWLGITQSPVKLLYQQTAVLCRDHSR